MRIRPPDPSGVLRKPKKVAVRRRFVRNPELAERFEKQMNRYETEGIEVLRALDSPWPLDCKSSERIALAFLVAIHLIRNPYGQQDLIRAQQDNLDSKMPTYRQTMSEPQITQLLEEVTAERFRVETMLERMPKLASMIASMHWTVLEFSEPLLATGDQPVTIAPLLSEGSSAPVQPLPSNGLLNTEEIRFPLDPSHALLLTWLNEPDDGPALPCGDQIAAELNRAVIGQVDKDWFHHPERRPTTVTASNLRPGGCGLIGRALLHGYTAEQARDSRRRHDAARNLDQMIDEEITDRLIVAGVGRAAAETPAP
jgi:hypothetical protein